MAADALHRKVSVLIEDTFYRELISNKYRNHASYTIEVLSGSDRLTQHSDLTADTFIVEDHFSGTRIESILSVVRLHYPEAGVVVLTDDPASSRRVELMRQGAYDVVLKDENTLDLIDQLLHRMLSSTARTYKLSGTPSVSFEGASLGSVTSNERTLEEYTMDIIQQFLTKYNNNVVLVARKLGVGKSTIYRYLKDNKLTLSGFPSARAGKSNIPSLTTVEQEVPRPSDSGGATVRAPYFQQKISADTNGLVDLNYLLEIYSGDRKSVATMIDIFLQTMDRHITQLKKYQSEQDVTGVLRSLQEMKPVVEYMGMQPLKSLVVQSRMMIDTQMEWGVVTNSLVEVYSMFARCAEELREKRREIL